jgi:hypothetical protein
LHATIQLEHQANELRAEWISLGDTPRQLR